MKSTTKQSGFTLVELAIVLVIIGLIVGGVLVGQDLIKAAQIRAAVGQLDKFDAAANAFRGKYNGLPGDLANCANFFVAADCPSGGTSGNGSLEDFSNSKVLLSGEVVGVWKHLYDAGYVGDAITNTANIGANTNNFSAIANVLPASKVGSGAYFVAYTVAPAVTAFPGFSGVNAYRLTGVTAISAGAAPTLSNPLTPLEAFQLDTKKDDGVPNSGIVQATDNGVGSFGYNATEGNTSPLTSSTCLATASTYNTTTSNGVQNTVKCSALVRASW